DALLIFQGCFDGTLSHCSRRPHDRERNSLITSGNVFVYEEATSGIKRWTDGIPWSPSRILTNFLIYRQLNSPFPPGEKKRATKRTARVSRPGEPYSTPTSSGNTPTADDHKPFPAPPMQDSPLARQGDEESPEKDSNRGLVGSLVDSYEFKEGGLLKKTMTVVVRNVHHHLVSYYNLEDAKKNLRTPREDPRVKDLTIQPELLKQAKFKFLNIDDAGDGAFEGQEQQHYGAYYQPQASHYYQHPYSYPASMSYQHPAAYAPSHPPPQHYGSLPPSSSMYAPAAAPSYSQYHQQQYYPQHVQNAPQYHPAYTQHYQGHHNPAQPPVTPVKQEAGSSATPQYNYNTSAPVAPLNDVYAGHQPNGSSAAPEDENVVPATTQPGQSQTWPIQNYNQQWPGRPEGPSYPAYRPSA
ncbi:uncharacterized protein KY384_003550, partial [Bacidia gigantensis]|uniref:uncharacterized protein n=1 Tax=Bacidia gigantensis TaxID=2732470 RepID=UPI001D04E46B